MTFFRQDEQLETLGTSIIEAAQAEFTELAGDRIALTWIVYNPQVRVNTGGPSQKNFGNINPEVLVTELQNEYIQPASSNYSTLLPSGNGQKKAWLKHRQN